jgi:hypothetical protein
MPQLLNAFHFQHRDPCAKNSRDQPTPRDTHEGEDGRTTPTGRSAAPTPSAVYSLRKRTFLLSCPSPTSQPRPSNKILDCSEGIAIGERQSLRVPRR